MKTPTVVDVAARDGLQNEATPVSTADKLHLLRRLEAAGVRTYEATSFVHPRFVPQMADAEAVLSSLPPTTGISRIALVVNGRGFERARAAGVTHIRLVVAATDTMNRKNMNVTIAETMRQYAPLLKQAKQWNITTMGVVAVAFGCPFEGAVDPGIVLELAARLVESEVQEVDFADTAGMAVPAQITGLLSSARRQFPGVRLGLHLHNTRNMGLANAIAGLEAGVDVLDSALGGMGGCPFVPDATGNIPTEDLVFMLHNMGIVTGIDLDALILSARWLETTVGHSLPGMLMHAGNCWTSPPPVAGR